MTILLGLVTAREARVRGNIGTGPCWSEADLAYRLAANTLLRLTRNGPQRGCPEMQRDAASSCQADRVGVTDQVSPPAKISFLMTA